MSPAHISSALPAASTAPSGPALVLGTLESAADGTYQTTVDAVKAALPGTQVELQMIDRVLEGATTLPTESYSSAHLTVTPASSKNLSQLLGFLVAALLPEGRLELRTSEGDTLKELGEGLKRDLRFAGFVDVEEEGVSVVATKPTSTATAALTVPLRQAASSAASSKTPIWSTTSSPSTAAASQVALPLRSSTSAAAAKKAKLWALTSAPSSSSSSPAPTLINESTLLTADDMRPSTCPPVSSLSPKSGPGKRKKRACKNCSCGLRELEDEEEKNEEVVLLDDDEGDDWKIGGGVGKKGAAGVNGESGRKVKKVNTGAVSSSCGSCYLGDAFRCSSCPYLGLPAFEPGQKVEIPVGMMDDDF